MRNLLKGLALTVLLILMLGLVTAQSDDEPAALDITIVLDVSGSMDYETDRNRYPSVDAGLSVLFNQRLIETSSTPTDPGKLRFSAAETLMEWLAAYSAQYPNTIDINASIITFSEAPQVVMDWQELRRTNDGTDALLEPLSRSSVRPEGDQPQNSNFVALYQTLSDQFSSRPSENRRVVLLVTDSVPCFPEGRRDANAPLYDRYCSDIPSMGRHIDALSGLSGAVEHVIFVNPLGAAHWGQDAFQPVLQAWQNRLGNRGSFREIPNINALPAAMMDATMRELGVALGVIDTNTSSPDDAVTPEQYIEMGIGYAANGAFQVPPFQSYMDVLSLLPNDAANFSLTTPQNTNAEITTLYGTDGKSMRIARVIQPPPGDWKANDPLPQDTPTWVLFRAGEAALEVFGDTPAQYGTLRFRYTLTDQDGQRFTFTPQTIPDFRFEVTPADSGGEDIDLSAFEIDTEDNTALISPPLLAFTAGDYDLSLEVTSGTDALWSDDVNYDFLQPTDALTLRIPAVTFVAEYKVVGRVTDSTDTDTTVNMPRSLPLTVRLTTNPEGNLPEDVTAKVVFAPPQDANTRDVCPQQDPVNMGIDKARLYATSPEIRFAQQGGCNLSVEVSIISTLPPLDGQTQVISTGNSRAVTVTNTQRLTYQVMRADGETPVDNDPQTSDYTLNFPNDLALGPNQLVLRVEVRDENGRLTTPEFLEGEETPNGQNCRAPSAINTVPPEEGETPTETLTTDISGQKVVPFRLIVTNSANADVAASNGVCLYATDRDGVYQAVLSGLSTDTYTVQVALDNNSPRLNYERFEWQPSLFGGDFSVPARLEATIQVNLNPLVVTVYGSAALAVAVVVVLAIVLIARHRQATVAPLTAGPSIYLVDDDAQRLYAGKPDGQASKTAQEPIWEKAPPRRNSHVYKSSDFLTPDLIALGIESLKITTAKDKKLSEEKSFYYEISRSLSGMQKSSEPLKPNQVVELAQTEDNRRYFLVNRGDGAKMFSVHELMTQRTSASTATTDSAGEAS